MRIWFCLDYNDVERLNSPVNGGPNYRTNGAKGKAFVRHLLFFPFNCYNSQIHSFIQPLFKSPQNIEGGPHF